MFKRWMAALLALVCLNFAGGARASDEGVGFRCALHMTLYMDNLMNEPFDRWSEELAALIVPELEYLAWPEGEALHIDVYGMDKPAFSISVVRIGERVALQSSLMGDGQVLLTGDQALDALNLLASASALAPDTDWPNADCTLNIHAARAIQALIRGAAVIGRWAEDASCEQQERARALSESMAVLGTIIAGQPSNAPLISVFVDYLPPNARPLNIREDASAAPPELLCVLATQLPETIARTIADASAARDAQQDP